MKTLIAIAFVLSPFAASAVQCGSSQQELRNLKANRGPVVIDGVVRYGAFGECNPGRELVPMFRYYSKQNVISFFTCTGGQVFYTDADDGGICENLGPDRREDPNTVVARALRQHGGHYETYARGRGNKPFGMYCNSASECASGQCRPRIIGVGPYVCR